MSSLARNELERYIAGQTTAERLLAAVSAVYYGNTGNGKREALRPIIEVMERSAPGIVALTKSETHPGFSVGLAERSFPAHYEAELRQAVTEALGRLPVGISLHTSGVWHRLLQAMRRLFTA